jgi:chromosome segregation ATPase
MTMAPYEIEDTDDWLGSPTLLETCQHQLRMYENEFEELNLQLRQAREKIFKLVQMNDELSEAKTKAETELKTALTNIERLNSDCSDLNIKVRSLLMVSDQRDHLFRENQKLLREKQERNG